MTATNTTLNGTKQRKVVIEAICSTILAIQQPRPILFAIDGIDTSGKTSIASELRVLLEQSTARQVVVVSIDGFHNPRAERGSTAEDYYRKSFNWKEYKRCVIEPVREYKPESKRSSIITRIFDHTIDSTVLADPTELTPDAIVLCEGVFMHSQEIPWDGSIFVDISFETGLNRAEIRDGAAFEGDLTALRSKYTDRYFSGQKLYITEHNPKVHATIVIDNNEINAPRITTP